MKLALNADQKRRLLNAYGTEYPPESLLTYLATQIEILIEANIAAPDALDIAINVMIANIKPI